MNLPETSAKFCGGIGMTTGSASWEAVGTFKIPSPECKDGKIDKIYIVDGSNPIAEIAHIHLKGVTVLSEHQLQAPNV